MKNREMEKDGIDRENERERVRGYNRRGLGSSSGSEQLYGCQKLNQGPEQENQVP